MGRTVYYDVRESIVNGINPAQFATQARIDVLLQRIITQPRDRTVVYFSGWGEVSASSTGGFADVVMDATEKDGSENPGLIFPNTGGRGTFDAASKNRASLTSFRAGMEDARRLPKELLERGDLNGPVSVIGHSMGYMAAWSFIEGLLDVKAKNPAAPFNLKSITGLMPATDEALGTMSWRFDKAVAPHVLPAAIRYLSKKKESLGVTPEEYNALMFGDAQYPDQENYKRSVPDSAAVFLEWAAMNFKRKPLPTNDWTGVRANILWAGQEALLPDKMGLNEARFLRENGVKAHYHTLQNFSHAIPYEMSKAQKEELLNHWVALI
jgi:pimeloyl-ACP methyl ester carboxylesterase